jgi:hypothetical protein
MQQQSGARFLPILGPKRAQVRSVGEPVSRTGFNFDG